MTSATYGEESTPAPGSNDEQNAACALAGFCEVSDVPPPTTVVYVDTLLLLASLSFLMDYLLLWATAKVARTPRRPWRLALGAGIGALYFVAYYLSQRGIGFDYDWLRYWPSLVTVSVGMLATAFWPLPWPTLLRVTGYFYFIAVSSGGAGVAAGYALGWGAAGQLAASVAAILVTAEVGWGVVQRTVWQRLYHVTLEIVLFGEKVAAQALVDTGNRLKDPLGGAPVVVVEHSVVSHLLPEHLRPVLAQMETGDLSGISRLLTSERWSSRFRIIPYTSLGKEKGLLVGFRPDEASVVLEGRRIPLDRVVVALHPNALDPEGVYRALVHPDLLDVAPLAEAPGAWTLSTPSHEGERPHVTPSA